MKNVTRSKNMLINDKTLNSTFREDIFNGILNVAKLESLNGGIFPFSKEDLVSSQLERMRDS